MSRDTLTPAHLVYETKVFLHYLNSREKFREAYQDWPTDLLKDLHQILEARTQMIAVQLAMRGEMIMVLPIDEKEQEKENGSKKD